MSTGGACARTELKSGVREVACSRQKSFWPWIKETRLFAGRRAYLEFMRERGGRLYTIGDRQLPFRRPPFLLLGAWRNRPETAAIYHVSGTAREREKLVREVSSERTAAGVEKVVTLLLTEPSAGDYRRWGFHEVCRIVMLERSLLREIPDPDGRADGLEIEDFKPSRMQEVLEIDHSAFEPFWRLDERTLLEIAASCRYNVFLTVRVEGNTAGYVIGGARNRLGYLQRLGVAPAFQGRGLGKILACELLRRLRDVGTVAVLVNTQDYNQAALSLYRSLGFLERPGFRYIMGYPPPGEGKAGS